MLSWDWNRVAYVFFVLAVFSALVKVGGMTLADSGPMTPRIANAATATTDREPPWYMGTFLKLEDDRGFLGESPTESTGGGTPPEPPSTAEGAGVADGSGASSEAPVFYRPSKGTGTGPVCGNLSRTSEDSRVVFPLAGEYSDSYSDTWGAPRPQGGHEGTDLMVPAGTPEYAVTEGTVVAVSGANANGWNTLGGYTVMIEAENTVGPIKAGDLFYYAHMESPSELPIGSKVQAGQMVGRAGDTGQGPEITTGLFPAHLHLGWYDGSGGRTKVESGAMNPYPLLEWLNGNGGSVSGGSGASYCEAPQIDGPRPSTGEDDWPTPANPGERPDLDTGSDHVRPSPAVDQQRPDRGNTDTPRNDMPEEPPEVHIGTPGTGDDGDDDADDEDRDFIGEVPDNGSGDDPEIGPGDPEDGDGDLPGIVNRIIDDGHGSGLADDLSRWREGIRAMLPDLLPNRRGPRPDEGGNKDRGGEDKRNGKDGREVHPGDRGDRSRNDDPKSDDPPDEEPTDEGSTGEGQPDDDAFSDEDQSEGEAPDDDGGTDAGEETDDTESENPAQEGEGSAIPSGE